MENLQSKLFEAAKQGSIHSLQQLLKHDPLILDIAAVSCFNESSPLHVAAMLGHVDFVKEIVRVKPELVDELNSQQSTPLHLASAKGHVEVVRVLLSVDQRACLARDRNDLTPLHLAAGKGRVEVVKVLLEAQLDAAFRGKSILHLCVERCQLEALKILVRAVGEEAFTNSVDVDGNTALHLAVADKQVETVKFLVGVGVEVNAVNSEGMRAVDVLIGSKRDVRDSEIEKSLKHGGGYRSATLETNNNNTRTRRSADKKDKEESWESSVKKHEDWLEKTKSGLMVVASLIATMAFQIGVNPPSGVWQDDKTFPNGTISMEAGSSVFAHKYLVDYRRFYIINTVAFIASLSIILFLMSGFRMRRRFFMWILVLTTWVAISAIALSYILVIDALSPAGDKYQAIVGVIESTIIVWLVLMALLLITHTIRLIIMLVRKIQDYSLDRSGRSRSLV